MSLVKKILHHISVLVYLFFALLLFLSNISVFIDPGKIWPFAFLGLFFPYLLLINFGFLIFWLFKRKWLFLVSLSILLLGYNNISAYVQLPFSPFKFLTSKKSLSNTKIKILTYNVRSFNRTSFNGIQNSTDDIIKLVKTEKPDIVCFQEFYSNSKGIHSFTDILSKLKPLKYFYAFCSYSNQSEANIGVVIFSKFPIIKKKQLVFKQSINTSMYCDVLIKKDTVRIFNNHLQSFQLLEGDLDFFDTLRFSYDLKNKAELKSITYKLREAYKKRASQANLVSENIKKSPYSTIVCGDFNDTPVSYAYRKMKGDLYDSFKEKGTGISNTYNGKIPSFRID